MQSNILIRLKTSSGSLNSKNESSPFLAKFLVQVPYLSTMHTTFTYGRLQCTVMLGQNKSQDRCSGVLKSTKK